MGEKKTTKVFLAYFFYFTLILTKGWVSKNVNKNWSGSNIYIITWNFLFLMYYHNLKLVHYTYWLITLLLSFNLPEICFCHLHSSNIYHSIVSVRNWGDESLLHVLIPVHLPPHLSDYLFKLSFGLRLLSLNTLFKNCLDIFNLPNVSHFGSLNLMTNSGLECTASLRCQMSFLHSEFLLILNHKVT